MKRAILLCLSLMFTLFLTAPATAARFIDNGDQTVTDTATGLMWTKSANFAGTSMSWQLGLDYVASLNSANRGAGTLGHNDWRDPTSDELMTLVDTTRSFPALPAGHPFLDVQSDEYWSSSSPGDSLYAYAYGVNMAVGTVYSGHKPNEGFIWPVRGAQSATRPTLAVSPASADFGAVAINTVSAPQSFTVSNSGTANLIVSAISLTGTNSSLFSLAPGSCGTLAPTLAPGGSCTISATFTTTTTGSKSAAIRIASNDPLTPTKDISLTGSGATVAADTTAPVVTAFSIPATSASLTIPVTAFTATDNVAVTGYCITEAATSAGCTWTAGAPAQYTFATETPSGRTLYAWAKDAAGNTSAAKSATTTLALGDRTPPQLTVSALSDGAVTGSAVINIAGTATDANGISQLTIGGFSVTVNADGSFSYPIVLQPGNNTITSVATDPAGNRTVDTRSITLGQVLPGLTIDQPADNSTANASFVTVSGHTADAGAAVTISVNGGSPQSAALSGTSFTAVANLAAGVNTIEVTVATPAGDKNTLKRTVVSDAQRPTIAITSPAQDFQTTAAQTIYGSIANAITPVTVTVNDGSTTYTPAVTSGSFSQPLTLAATKTYPVSVTVTEANGNRTTVQRNILFKKIDPGARFTDNGDQTVTDNLSGFMWTKNANLPNLDVSWQEGLDYVAAMNGANGGAGTFGHNDWRLPKLEELESLVDSSRTLPALPLGHPFLNVAWDEYWSSSLVPNKYAYVFGVNMGSGISYSGHDYNFGFVWPVRSTKAAAPGLPSSTTGAAYNQQVTPDWGTAPYRWSLAGGALPAGLTLDSSTGVISGTATRSGVYSFNVLISDASGASVTRPLAITINDVACSDSPVRIAAATYVDFPDAYGHAADNDLIRLQALDFTSDLLFNRNIGVNVIGGYDCGYTSAAAATSILGNLKVTNGTVKIGNLRLR